jgi:TatD DNase family protein
MRKDEEVRGCDFHCHIDLNSNPVAVMDRCSRERVFVLAVTTTPKAWEQNYEWATKNSFIRAATGLHPELVGERYSEIDLLEKQISKSRFVGEVGLDRSKNNTKSYDKQKIVFGRILDTSQKLGGRLLTIHSRSAGRDVVQMIEEHTDSRHVLCVLHWFSGSLAEARKAVDADCYFSINRNMLGHDRGRNLVKNLPTDRLLTETDSPFTMIGNRKSLPWDVIETTETLAEVCGIKPEEMAQTVLANARRVLSFTCTEIPSFVS